MILDINIPRIIHDTIAMACDTLPVKLVDTSNVNVIDTLTVKTFDTSSPWENPNTIISLFALFFTVVSTVIAFKSNLNAKEERDEAKKERDKEREELAQVNHNKAKQNVVNVLKDILITMGEHNVHYANYNDLRKRFNSNTFVPEQIGEQIRELYNQYTSDWLAINRQNISLKSNVVDVSCLTEAEKNKLVELVNIIDRFLGTSDNSDELQKIKIEFDEKFTEFTR